jgi:hypothetical protein
MNGSELDERIQAFASKPSYLSPKLPPYQEGDMVWVRVTALAEYGAFVETMDGRGIEGLVHIRQIADPQPASLEEIRDLLEVGQKIEAKVKRVITEGKDRGKIECCLLHLGLKLRNTPLAGLGQLRELLPEKNDQPPKRDVPPDDKEEIARFLSGEFGVLSNAAREKMEKMVDRLGVFRFTMAMTKVLEHFERDLALHFLREVEKQADECL